jgi:hypothetical protein
MRSPPSAIRILIFAGAFALAGVGCGGGATPEAKSPRALKMPNPFPTKGALDDLSRRRLPAQPARTVAAVPEWRVDSSEVPDSSPVEQRLADLGGGLRFTRDLRCVARELGRLRAEHHADADERLEHFIVGACGLSTAGGVSTYHLTGDVPSNVTDEQLLAAWKGKLSVPATFKGRSAGAWLTRTGTQAILMLVAAPYESNATLAPTETAGRIVVRGVAPADTERVVTLINQGRSGVGPCEPDRSVELPRFTFTCTMGDGDPWAWVEVATQASGRVLLRPMAFMLARRDAQGPLELPRTTVSSAATSAADVEAAVLDGVNRARIGAKLGPVTSAAKQASENARLAPHFFNATVSGDGQTSDTVALGLLAGWDVGGTIRNGGFFGTMLSGTKDPASWIDYALEHPLGRLTLLEPNAQRIAIGAAPPDSTGGLGVVVTTYSFFGAEDHQANSARVMQRLADERAARHLPPLTALGDLPALVNEARLVNAGKREPMAALDTALQAESQRMGQAMRGWVVVTHDLDVLPFPNELFAQGPLAVRVIVTHYRPEGIPWGAYLVYVVAPAPAQQQVASNGRPSSVH